MSENLDLLGAIAAHVIFVSSIVTFAARMVLETEPGHWIGVPLLLMVFPLGYLLWRAPDADRPLLYYIQVGLMLGWIVLLFILDYAPGVAWRDTRWMLISVVVLYFAALGGMIGVASLAGRPWMISAIVLFFVTGILAFVSRALTGI